MPAAASILHADADAFFASVEQRDDPGLRGKPVVVGVGVVMAASYAARAYGIHGGMGGRRARRLCPGLVAVPPRFDAYTEASRALFDLFHETAPLVEGLSLEEAFLDIRGLEHISGTPRQIAERLRRRARDRIGLAVTVGVARTKVLAKMASRAAKPDGLLIIDPAREEEFLMPLPVEALWGVGPATAEKLHSRGIHSIEQLGRVDQGELARFLGGRRKVRSGRRRRSIGTQSAFAGGGRSGSDLDTLLVSLVDRVTRRARAANRAGRTVTLRLRFGDFSRATRSRTLEHPSAGTGAILAAARMLLAAAGPLIERRGITMLGITVANLTGYAQLELPLDPRVDPALDLAIDEIRKRFGNGAIRRGGLRPSAPRHVTQV